MRYAIYKEINIIMITITQNAKTYLANMLEQHDKPYVYLRVEGGGCSGIQYKWDFTE